MILPGESREARANIINRLILTKYRLTTSSRCKINGKNETGAAGSCNAGPVIFNSCGSRCVLRVRLSPRQTVYF
jgi:hypothetical protein